MERTNIRKDMENKMKSILNARAIPRILYQERKSACGIFYKIYVIEYVNGTRKMIIEREATKRLPRGFVASPPAPLLNYIKLLKKTYNIQ